MNNERPAEFESVVKSIIKLLAYEKRFAYYDKEDIGQEIWMFCLESIKFYDGKRSLYNFLLTCVKRKIINLQRDKYFRSECPCKLCSFKEEGATDHRDKKKCKKYLKWLETNARKKNLACPIITDFFRSERLLNKGTGHEEMIDIKDFFEMIDEKLPIQMRPNYLKLKSGVFVPPKEKEEIFNFIKQYLEV